MESPVPGIDGLITLVYTGKMIGKNNGRSFQAGIIEDDPVYREFLEKELKQNSRIKTITTYINGERFFQDESSKYLNLLFVDLMLPGQTGDVIISRAREQNPDTVICVVSSILEEKKIFACLQNGAVGYIWKQDLQNHPVVINHLLEGGGILTPSVAVLVADHFRKKPVLNANLTNKEKQIIEVLVSGYKVIDAAKLLGITEHTIRTHVKNIYKKLQVQSLNQLNAVFRKYDVE